MSYKDLEISTEVSSIHTEEDLFKQFPKAKELYSKISHAFWEVKKKHFVKIYYRNKEGISLSTSTSFMMDEVDFNTFDVASYYKKI